MCCFLLHFLFFLLFILLLVLVQLFILSVFIMDSVKLKTSREMKFIYWHMHTCTFFFISLLFYFIVFLLPFAFATTTHNLYFNVQNVNCLIYFLSILIFFPSWTKQQQQQQGTAHKPHLLYIVQTHKQFKMSILNVSIFFLVLKQNGFSFQFFCFFFGLFSMLLEMDIFNNTNTVKSLIAKYIKCMSTFVWMNSVEQCTK